MLPIPKYLKSIKKVSPREYTAPRSEFARRIEKVKRRTENTRTKNRGMAPEEEGSTKYTRAQVRIHKSTVIKRVGRKFFLSFTSF